MAFDLSTILGGLQAIPQTVNTVSSLLNLFRRKKRGDGDGLSIQDVLGGASLGAGALIDKEPGEIRQARQFERNLFTSPNAISDLFGQQTQGLLQAYQPLLAQQRNRLLDEVQQRFVSGLPGGLAPRIGGPEIAGIRDALIQQILPSEQGLMADISRENLSRQQRAAEVLLATNQQDPLAKALAQLGTILLLRDRGGETGIGGVGTGSGGVLPSPHQRSGEVLPSPRQIGQLSKGELLAENLRSVIDSFGGLGTAISNTGGILSPIVKEIVAAMGGPSKVDVNQRVPNDPSASGVTVQSRAPNSPELRIEDINLDSLPASLRPENLPGAIPSSFPGGLPEQAGNVPFLPIPGFAPQRADVQRSKTAERVGSGAGAALGTALGTALAPETGGLSLLLAPLFSKIGEEIGGSIITPGAAQKALNRQADLDSQFGQVQQIGSFFSQALSGLGADANAFTQFAEQQASISAGGPASFSFDGISDTQDQQLAVAEVGGRELLRAAQARDPNITSLNQIPGLRQKFIDFLLQTTFTAGGGPPRNLIEGEFATVAGL